MERMKRTATCGALHAEHEGQSVVLNGWVHRKRDHGGVRFFNLRDRYGITQVVLEEPSEQLVDAFDRLRMEFCVAVTGTVRRRPAGMVNPEMPTGEVELVATELEILSPAVTLPFTVDERSDAREELRLKHRYLDLRSHRMQRNIRLRHDVSYRVREYLHSQDFLEIETPTMIKSTPEGARDFLVPSRLHHGCFYAMPQSPQLYKQILMIAGFDRYFQLAHCFRDEDARGDRQPEHTQIDLEMSFASKEDVFEVTEGMLAHVFSHVLGVSLETPFPRLSFHEAMERYGSDRPDLRFDLELVSMDDAVAGAGFRVFDETIESGGVIKGLRVPGGADASRKRISDLEETAKTYGAKGLAWTKVTDGGLEGGIGKFLAQRDSAVREQLAAEPGDLLLFVADAWRTACTALGAVRTRLGPELDLVDPDEFAFAWVTDFPLFSYNEEEQRWEAEHHMFSMPQERFLDTLETDPGSVLGDLYDLVGNGLELASGSIRIHDPELQSRIFRIVGFDWEEAERRFGFLLEALRYGAPPHGGIAPGLDRLVALMAGESTIRDVIAFPKTTQATSPMDGSPSPVAPAQLAELGLRVVSEEKEERERTGESRHIP